MSLSPRRHLLARASAVLLFAACTGPTGPGGAAGPSGSFDPALVIQNGTTPQARASFNISGTGTLTRLSINGAGADAFKVSNPTPSAPRVALITASTLNATSPILEVRHDNLTQGVSIGYASILATGTNLNQNLEVDARGTGSLVLNGNAGGGVGVGVGTTFPGAKFNVNGVGLFGTTSATPYGEPVQTGGAFSGVGMFDRAGGANPRWVLYPNASSARLWNQTNGDMLSVDVNGTAAFTQVNTFDPATVTANHIVLGHAHSVSAWDATGMCAQGAAGNTMCSAVNSGIFYWGYQASASTMSTAMQLAGSTGNLWIGGTLTQASSARFKKDIHFLEKDELQGALALIEATPVATYRYKVAGDDTKVNWGVIAEKTPKPLLAEDDQGVNLSNTVGVLLAAVKAQQAEIAALKDEVKALQAKAPRAK